MKITDKIKNSLAVAIDEALAKDEDGSRYEDWGITFDGEGFQFWNTTGGYSHAILETMAIIVMQAPTTALDGYAPEEGQIYASAFCEELVERWEDGAE